MELQLADMSQFLTPQLASSNGSAVGLGPNRPIVTVMETELDSSAGYLLAPEVRIMQDIAGHGLSRRNRNSTPTGVQSHAQLGYNGKKRSLKARMHPHAIQSYLGLAVGDPIQMVGLQKSNMAQLSAVSSKIC